MKNNKQTQLLKSLIKIKHKNDNDRVLMEIFERVSERKLIKEFNNEK